MSIISILEQHIRQALADLDIQAGEIVLEHPADLRFGDYSTNVAMAHAKAAGQNPRALAESIVSLLEKQGMEGVEVAGPGFINFRLERSFFAGEIRGILSKGEGFGKNQGLKGQRIMVEYTDPNPFKEFHIGHLMANAVGESLSRLVAWQGAHVIRANYQGDVGLHVAKALWAMLRRKDEFPEASTPLVDRIRYISSCYVEGSKAYEEGGTAKEEIHAINKQVFDRSDGEINRLYDLGREWTLAHFEELYRKLGTKFDHYFFESEMAPVGMEIVKDFLSKGVFEESDGAVVFKGEEYGLHTRVFINSQGLPTYEAKEIGLNTTKFRKEKLDRSVIITANEQDDYFKVVMEALRHIAPEVAERTQHISHGMLRFAEGKMSSRKGNIITGGSLLADAEARIHEKVMDRGYDDALKADIAEKVAVAAIKYSVLKQSIGADIVYDFEKSLSFEGDSGPYLQYTYARARSVLEKAKEAGIVPSADTPLPDATELEKIIYRFPEVVARAGNEYAPHHVASFLIEAARSFNAFYGSTKIIEADDELSPYRLALTEATATVIKNGLYVLGIQVPERM